MSGADLARLLGGFVHHRKQRMYQPAERRERDGGRAHEKLAADLALEPLHGSCQCGLADVASPGGTREIPLLANRKEVTDLLQIHYRPRKGIKAAPHHLPITADIAAV
jgi:hypothetical protein